MTSSAGEVPHSCCLAASGTISRPSGAVLIEPSITDLRAPIPDFFRMQGDLFPYFLLKQSLTLTYYSHVTSMHVSTSSTSLVSATAAPEGI